MSSGIKQHEYLKRHRFINLSLAVAKILGNNNRGIPECMISSDRQSLRFQNSNQDYLQ